MANLTPEQKEKLRYICQTDLYALGKDILQKPNWSEKTHRPMCEFYVKKVPGVPFVQFARQYVQSHDRMQLIPRRAFKSTIKVLDNVQWIITYPDIRICAVTAEKSLASAFIDELIDYFVIKGKAERNQTTNLVEGGRPTLFQTLFPEHCITENEATAAEFWTPAVRNNLVFKEPTAGVLSMETTSSGWGCDILDFDDPVSDKNAETGNLLERLYDRIHMISNTLIPHGFRHFVATRYDPQDPYGKIAEENGCKILYGDYETADFKYMCRPCWWLKDRPYEQPDYRTWVPNRKDMDFFFKEWLNFDFLVKKMKNFKTFSSQQLNAPIAEVDVTFPKDFLRANFVHPSALPKVGLWFGSWDFAYTSGLQADYSAGILGFLDQKRRWWIVDIKCERYNPTEKIYEVVKMMRLHHPKRICIEGNPGTRETMAESIDRKAKEEKVEMRVDWVRTGAGRKDAKYLRIAALHSWVKDKRLFFLNNIAKLDDMLEQFSKVRRGNSKFHNDIPDAIARMVQEFTIYMVELPGGGVPATAEEETSQRHYELAQQEMRDLILGNGKYAEDGSWARGEWNADYVAPPVEEDKPDPTSPSYVLDMLQKDNF